MRDFDPNNVVDCKRWLEAIPSTSFNVQVSGEACGLGDFLERAIKMALVYAQRMTTPCEWKKVYGTTLWHSVCEKGLKHVWTCSPSSKGMVSCPYCAHPVKEVPYQEPTFENPTKGLT